MGVYMIMSKRLNIVARFASKDETRHSLGFCVHDQNLKALVATDGHRAILDKRSYIK